MSDVSPLARAEGGPGRRAALICPRGAEDGVMVLGSMPSLATRSEGGLGGEGEPCNGSNVGGDLEAAGSWLSTSGGCDSDSAGGEVFCISPSIVATFKRLWETVVVGDRSKSYARVIGCGCGEAMH